MATNQFAKPCHVCKTLVPAGKGTLESFEEPGGSVIWRVWHDRCLSGTPMELTILKGRLDTPVEFSFSDVVPAVFQPDGDA